jgi:hypothetical protein
MVCSWPCPLRTGRKKRFFNAKILGVINIVLCLVKTAEESPFHAGKKLMKKKVSTSYSALLIARCPQFFRCHDNVPNGNLPNNTCANNKIIEILQTMFYKRIPLLLVIYQCLQ